MSLKKSSTGPQKLKRQDLEVWDHVDPLRVIDAACLWADVKPAGDNSDPNGKTHLYCEIIRSKCAKLDPDNIKPALTDSSYVADQVASKTKNHVP